jgi:hypothetical protein
VGVDAIECCFSAGYGGRTLISRLSRRDVEDEESQAQGFRTAVAFVLWFTPKLGPNMLKMLFVSPFADLLLRKSNLEFHRQRGEGAASGPLVSGKPVIGDR